MWSPPPPPDEAAQTMAEPYLDLTSMFGVDRVNHGDPGTAYEWEWPDKERERIVSASAAAAEHSEGPAACPHPTTLSLRLPDSSVALMAQYVWQSAITLANRLALGHVQVKGESVVELGAGSALPSLVCALQGARLVVATDYPEEEIIVNMRRNLGENLETGYPDAAARVKVQGLKWGDDVSDVLSVNGGNRFDKVIMADTLWLKHEHDALLKSCTEIVLANDGRIVIVYMDHDDGAGIADSFFQKATKEYGLEIIESIDMDWKLDRDCYDENDPEAYGYVHQKTLRWKGPFSKPRNE